MGRSPCCDEIGLKKGPWTPEEDQILVDFIKKNGHGSWRALPKLAGLNRCGKSCRLRWTNYLRPDIKRGKFSDEEEQTILNLHSVLGNKWSAIASNLPGRTDNEIKNFWNTHLKKKLIQKGFDPITHRPRTDIFTSFPHLIALANLKGLIDHQSLEQHALRLQAEAVQMAKLQYLQYLLQPNPPPSNIPTTSNTINNSNIITSSVTDLESFNLLNSLASTKDNGPLSGSAVAPIGFDESVTFSHLPDLQFALLDLKSSGIDGGDLHQLEGFSEGQNSPNSPWLLSSSTPSPRPPSAAVPPPSAVVTQSTPTDWQQLLLEDPLFHEIPLN